MRDERSTRAGESFNTEEHLLPKSGCPNSFNHLGLSDNFTLAIVRFRRLFAMENALASVRN